ncbi:hypothetical protein E2C01_095806 [Portunus trituberculatus]|uniref:Uncharacterized protein n=1 Tax=Portunus trituberculatus TaxID=210409 RepID=A0A5B7K006_PORTR|nr:hypothetical protein [Portunus trituberculatus]
MWVMTLWCQRGGQLPGNNSQTGSGILWRGR